MNNNISPKYQMRIVQNDALFELYRGYDDVLSYLEKWHEVYDDFGHENFQIFFKDEEQKKIDTKRTLHNIDGDTLLKIAIDLGVETPDFIPSIPQFKNELKSSFETASQTFEKAYKNVETDPGLAIGLANSALESIIKEILHDERVEIQYEERDTLTKLSQKICKAFKQKVDPSEPVEVKTITSSLINICSAIETLRSSKTMFHGKTDDSNVISKPLYAYMIVNSMTTVGLFFLQFYLTEYPKMERQQMPWDLNGLPF